MPTLYLRRWCYEDSIDSFHLERLLVLTKCRGWAQHTERIRTMNAIKLGFLGKVFAISCLSLLALCGVAVADGPAGEWVIVTNAGGQETEATLNITESDGTVSGTITSDLGTADLNNLKFEDGVLTFDIVIDAQGQNSPSISKAPSTAIVCPFFRHQPPGQLRNPQTTQESIIQQPCSSSYSDVSFSF